MKPAVMRVGVFHPGTQNSWQRAVAFQEAGMLAWYATSLHFPADGAVLRWAARVPGAAGRRLRRLLARRSSELLEAQHLRRMGWLPPAAIAARRLGRADLARRLDALGDRRFGRSVTRLAAREPVDALWTHDGRALEAFRWAKPRGIACVLDQSIPHPRALNAVLRAERARDPEALRHWTPASSAVIARADAEIALADRVVVGSQFAYHTMIVEGCPAKKLRLVPYGWDETLFPDAPPVRPPLQGRPLELLFVGTVCARKGVGPLLVAMALLPPGLARLTLLGRLELPESLLRRPDVCHRPQVPRAEVPEYMRAADVLVLPSLFEGGGIVLYEALASGLAIVQSRHCGDGVQDGANGLVLDAVAPAAIAAAIHAAADPEWLARWQAASWARRESRSWAAYRRRLPAVLEGLGR